MSFKKIFHGMLALVFTVFVCFTPVFAEDMDFKTLIEKVKKLEQDNAELKSQVSEMKSAPAMEGVAVSGGISAKDSETVKKLEKDNEKLRSEVSTLKNELASLRDAVSQVSGKPSEAVSAQSKNIEKMKEENKQLMTELTSIKADISAIKSAPAPVTGTIGAAAPAAGANPVTSTFPIKIYGYLKADAIYNSSQLGALAMNAPTTGRDVKDEFMIIAKESRIGLDIAGPEIMGGKTLGKVEGDFWGNNSDSDTGSGTFIGTQFRLRQAYINLKYKSWDILAGQTWDFFSPLNPSTLNFAILWRAGNMGDRHPQVRLTNTFNDIAGGKLTTQIGALSTTDMQIDTAVPPVIAGYASYETDKMGFPFMIGTGALYGRQKISSAPNPTTEDNIWASTLVLKATPVKNVTIMGEGYIGSGLAAFRAGSATGAMIGGAAGTNANDSTGKSVNTRGGWMQVSWVPFDKLTLNGGMGIDNPYTEPNSANASSTNAGIWEYNTSFFTNFKYELVKNLIWGVEYQYFNTKYYTTNNGGTGNRIQTSLIFTF